MGSKLVKVGDTLPSVTVYEETPGNPIDIKELFESHKVAILIGVPGAFTPTCDKNHLPAFVKDYQKYSDKGVTLIACVSVNDPFVMKGWGETHAVDKKVRMLADTCGDLTKALGIELKGSEKGLGSLRMRRFAAVVKSGVITHISVEPGGELVCTRSQDILSAL